MSERTRRRVTEASTILLLYGKHQNGSLVAEDFHSYGCVALVAGRPHLSYFAGVPLFCDNQECLAPGHHYDVEGCDEN